MPSVHLLALTDSFENIFAVRTLTAWRLPCLEHDSRIGLGPQIEALLARIATTADIVHWAPVRAPDLRAQSRSRPIDEWYCVAVTSQPRNRRHASVVPCRRLQVQGALPSEQALALRTALSRLRSPVEAFDSVAGVAAALAWTNQQIARCGAVPITSVTRHRCARDDYVVRFQTAADTYYLKAGLDRIDEARLAQRLHAVRPNQCPETVAVDWPNHRWLYRALPGTTLRAAPLTQGLAARTVRALASLQKEAMGALSVVQDLLPRRMTAGDLYSRVDELVHGALLPPLPQDEHTRLLAAWDMGRSAFVRACTEIDTRQLPLTLVLSDFWSDNILLTPDESIGFIDVGNSYWSYPFLSLWRFVRDVERRLGATSEVRASIEQAFVDEWSDVIEPTLMIRGLADLPLLGQLFGILMVSCDLDRYERALGSVLPPGYRAERLAPRVRAVLMASALRGFIPRRNEPAHAPTQRQP